MNESTHTPDLDEAGLLAAAKAIADLEDVNVNNLIVLHAKEAVTAYLRTTTAGEPVGSPSDDLIAFCITETLGERCDVFDADCYTCQAWAQYDAHPSPDSNLLREARDQIADRLDEVETDADGNCRWTAVAEARDDVLRILDAALSAAPAGGEAERQTLIPTDSWPECVSDGLVSPCQRCGTVPKFDYRISDSLWRDLVPKDEQPGVICLPCLDRIAQEMCVDFAGAIEEVQFTGSGQTVILRPEKIVDYRARAALNEGGSDDPR